MALAQLNFDSNEAKAYMAIAVGILGLAYLWLRPALKKRRGDPLEKAPFSSLWQQRSVEREMQNLLVELAQMSRQITVQLDTRAEKLNLLIAEADRKIAELKRLTRGAVEGETSAEPACGETGMPARDSADHPTDARHGEIYELADAGLNPNDIAHRLSRPRGEVELILALRPDRRTAERIAG